MRQHSAQPISRTKPTHGLDIMIYNIKSPTRILSVANLSDLKSWASEELQQYPQEQQIPLRAICGNLDCFVKFPMQALLLWNGVTRGKTHKFPAEIKKLAHATRTDLDTRANGPAKAAFIIAEGVRPPRTGNMNGWHIHHIYSGKFPCLNREEGETLHAAKHPSHFSQAAGLVAIHPLADAAADEYPFFSWLLRAHAFTKFGYDPDSVFSGNLCDQFGFALGHSANVFYSEMTDEEAA